MRYNKLVEEYERVRGLLSKEQHLELISILEKRLPKNSRISTDYFKAKDADERDPHKWSEAMFRIIHVVSTARSTIEAGREYGNPNTIYSFPSTAIPPTRVTTVVAPRALATHDSPTPLQTGALAIRDDFDVPLIASLRVCRSCGNPRVWNYSTTQC